MTNVKRLPSPRVFLPKQKQVLDAISKYRYVLYSGAFGAGKTLLMCNAAIQTCINNPKAFGLFACQTVPMLRDTVIRTFHEEMELYQDYLKKEKIYVTLEKKWLPSQNKYTFFNGSDILFRSCDDPSKFKSLNLDFFIIDEPVDIDESIFLMLQGRLRGTNVKHRFGAMAGNPAGKMNWVYQRFFEKPTPEYFQVHTRTKDNTFLPEDYVTSMYDAYDFEYARRYLEGEWGSFVGLVYKDFDYDKHVGNYQDGDYDYYLAGVDVGFRNPTCILTIGVKDREVYIMNEYYVSQKTTDATVEHMSGLNGKYNFRKIFADPSAADWITKSNLRKMRVKDGDNDIDKGIAKIKSLFANDIIHIDRSCENLIKELESYRYDKDRMVANLTEKPMKKNDHACISGETIVNTTFGDVPIKNLVGTEGHVYSYKNGEIVARKYKNVAKTGEREILKIMLDDGTTMGVTKDHPFMLRGGDYINAGDLKVGDSLMPFHYNIDSHGHTLIYNTNGKREFAHRLVYRTVVSELPNDGWRWNIHHMDEDKLNNSPSNLLLVSRAEHCKIHAKDRVPSEETKNKLKIALIKVSKGKEWKKRNVSHLDSIRHLTLKWHKSDEGRTWHTNHGKECWDKEHREKKIERKKCLQCGLDFLTKDGTGLYCSNNCKAAYNRKQRSEKYGMRDTKRYSLIKEGKFNHRVKEIKIGRTEDVYNMYVNDTNNFACNNVIVHNCDAMRYGLSEFSPWKIKRHLIGGTW